MKILIYGGCHATALQRILKKYAVGNIAVDALINYRLIARKDDFPYEQLKNYDYILFNPILNRGEYNSSRIEDYCQLHGIRYFKYPWLQWGGYWPSPRKRNWGDETEWSLLYLKEHAEIYAPDAHLNRSTNLFESYYESMFQASHFKGLMQQEVELTTMQLQSRESEGGVDFRISQFILENFQRKQLFLTPDHPTTELYKFVVCNLTEAMGIRIDPSFALSNIEIQEGIRTPILPGVAEALKLDFHAADWGNDELFGEAYYSLRDYARTTFPAENIRLATACHTTRIKSPDSDRVISARLKSRLLVSMCSERTVKDHYMADVLGPPAHRGSRVLLYKPHWQLAAPTF